MRDLPAFYYLDHLLAVLEEVERIHGCALGEPELQLIEAFRAQPRMAQATWARMASRKGRFFTAEQLEYAEIRDVARQLERLVEHGFVRPLEERDVAKWLSSSTKAQVLEVLARQAEPPRFAVSWKKARLAAVAAASAPPGDLLPERMTYVQRREAPLGFISFLYFGRYAEDLRAIALRDLGLLRTRPNGGKATARFRSEDEARAAYFYERGRHHFRAGIDAEVERLVQSVDDWPEPRAAATMERRDGLLDRLGGRAEKAGDAELALALYGRSMSSVSREREVRIRYAAGEKDWVEQRLLSMIDDPVNDEECVFAADFHARKFGGQRTSAATELLRAGTVIEIDEAYRHEPERAAARHFVERGSRAWFAENRLWRALFGLTFWDLLFGPEARGFHGEFDHLPASLRRRSFLEENAAGAEARLQQLRDPAGLEPLIRSSTAAALREPNALFDPAWFEPEALVDLLRSDGNRGMALMLETMARDFPGHSSGYPDLALLDGDHARFIEVKAEGDSVRRPQLVRMEEMRAAGLDASILKVEWGLDPGRTYVVVDVETTGGRPPLHRVTEVAAVRVRHGEVLDTWSTLVNPERRIPANITQLTGISDEMVRSAPRFAEVADEFEAFLEGAIFVAHNVNFDYGFLGAEFRRLGRGFSHPKLCTVVQMRRYFPGSPSYSLGKLCREHGIELRHHHRALDDALATAELVKRIHRARHGDLDPRGV
ncbi:exonuclease domain-containing protein [Saltatorellus ferox]|uniref:exonuclease domain-containing protein n=1 Tax=Saltatorellus ferox TaxID=2528018 RepID=UPI003AF3D333